MRRYLRDLRAQGKCAAKKKVLGRFKPPEVCQLAMGHEGLHEGIFEGTYQQFVVIWE